MNASILATISSFLGCNTIDASSERSLNQKQTDKTLLAPSSIYETSFIHVIVFSKDRAFQLQQLLISLDMHVDFMAVEKKVSVIYTVSSSVFLSSYDALKRDHPAVNFVKETPDFPFISALITAVEYQSSVNDVNEFVIFAVDDMIFYCDPPFPIKSASITLTEYTEIFGIHLKLNPCITHSHASGCSCPVPALHLISSEESLAFHGIDDSAKGKSFATNSYNHRDFISSILRFDRSSVAGTVPNDWNYPWDLTGGMYRKSHALSLLKLIQSQFLNSHINPNLLETYGNQLIRNGIPNFPVSTEMGCLSSPILSVITVNRVQDTYNNPIYSTAGGDLLELESLFLNGANIDTKWYRLQYFSTVHIGYLCIKEQISSVINPSIILEPLLSIVLPFYNATEWISTSVLSILNQSFKRFELILVNDGSTDGYMDHLPNSVIHDSRVQIVSAEKRCGISKALMLGIESANTDLIVRMDADDICFPDRLKKLYEYMQVHSNIAVLGSGAISFVGNKPILGAQRYIYHPTGTYFLKWAMMFSCCMTHPTVILRKDAVVRSGGYHQNEEPAEDYGLWVRMLYPMQGIPSPVPMITCIPDPLLYLRRHAKSISIEQAEMQKSKSLKISVECICRMLGRIVNEEVVQILRDPVSIRSAGAALVAAYALLDLMKHAVLEALQANEKEQSLLIERDAYERLGFISSLSMKKFGSAANPIVELWLDRCNTSKSLQDIFKFLGK